MLLKSQTTACSPWPGLHYKLQVVIDVKSYYIRDHISDRCPGRMFLKKYVNADSIKKKKKCSNTHNLYNKVTILAIYF